MKKIFFIIILFLKISTLKGNNIKGQGLTILDQNTLSGVNHSANFTKIQFDLSWKNSWKINAAPSNWDAAWVFFKFRVGRTDPVLLNASSSGPIISVNSTLNLRVGMPVRVLSGNGSFQSGTVIDSILSPTQFTVNNIPIAALNSTTIQCKRIWEHCFLSDTGHTQPIGGTIDVGLRHPSQNFNPLSNPALGVFIYRNSNGIGDVNFNSIQIRWNYGIQGILDTASIEIKLFAIETVNVPQGGFFVGNYGVGSGEDHIYKLVNGNINPCFIASENQIPVNSSSFYYNNLWSPGDRQGPIPPSFPKGFNSFYCMKYEISQGQYRDFLNTLTYYQQNSRTSSSPNSPQGTGACNNSNLNRNGIKIETPGNLANLTSAKYSCNLNGNGLFNESNDGEWIACNFLSWQDGCAYLDWAGLRPMTELEFEKACRGPLSPNSNEYAWGNSSATCATGISNIGLINEVATNNTSNCNCGNNFGIQGPLRVGSFAKSQTTRVQSGGSYFGIMELSGNLWERTVTIGNPDGRAYIGIHGDGNLSNNGNANQISWPGLSNNEVVLAIGSGFRGGDYANPLNFMLVSDRHGASYENDQREAQFGFRGVRENP